MSGFKDQLGDTLFEPRYPHVPGHRGIDTQIEAAKKIAPHVSAMHAQILGFIRARGEYGATYREIMIGCRLEAPTVTGRLRELALKELIADSGKRRETSPGTTGRVYVAR